MRLVSWLGVVVACGTPAPPPQVPANTTPIAEPAPAADSIVTSESLPLGAAGSCAVGGTAVDGDGEVLAGATVVLHVGTNPQTSITDEKGRFLIQPADVPDKLEVYYSDAKASHAFSASWCGRALRIPMRPTI